MLNLALSEVSGNRKEFVGVEPGWVRLGATAAPSTRERPFESCRDPYFTNLVEPADEELQGLFDDELIDAVRAQQ